MRLQGDMMKILNITCEEKGYGDTFEMNVQAETLADRLMLNGLKDWAEHRSTGQLEKAIDVIKQARADMIEEAMKQETEAMLEEKGA